MRPGSIRLVVALALPLWLAAPPARAAGIRTDFDPEAPFSAYRSFRFVDLADAPASATGVISNPDLREGIESRLRIELERRGLQLAADGATPDLMVRWWTGLEQSRDVDRIGGYGIFLDGRWSSIYVTMQHENVGKGLFVLDLIDQKSGELAWRAYLPVKIDDPVATRRSFLKQIERALERFPPSEREIRRRAPAGAAAD